MQPAARRCVTMNATDNNSVDGRIPAAGCSLSASPPLSHREQERLRNARARKELERRCEERDLQKQLMEIWEEYVQRRQKTPSKCISRRDYEDRQ